MRIVDLLGRDSIYLNGKASGKTEVIDMMVSLMEKGGHLSDTAAYKQAVLKREAEGTTGDWRGYSHSPRKNRGSVKSGTGGDDPARRRGF